MLQGSRPLCSLSVDLESQEKTTWLLVYRPMSFTSFAVTAVIVLIHAVRMAHHNTHLPGSREFHLLLIFHYLFWMLNIHGGLPFVLSEGFCLGHYITQLTDDRALS